MKKLLKQIFVLTILIFIPPLSFAELSDHNFETSIEEGGLYIIAQIQIRDFNENLVGYIETDRVTVTNLETLTLILDDISGNDKNTKMITIDDKKYHVITEEYNAKYLSDISLSISYIASNDDEFLAYVNYDGFPIRSGDIVITTWTIVRLV